MRVLIVGAGGQLGSELQHTCPKDVHLVAVPEGKLNICDEVAVADFFRSQNLDLVINAAAYTAVDKAESDSELAYKVNEQGIANIVKHASKQTKIIHISTDFVFSGDNSRPYQPEAHAEPASVYGKSKLAGERVCLEHRPDALIFRTSWVYSCFGNNFVKSMLRFMSEKPQLGIVVDQVGTPTWARGLAQLCWAARESDLSGIYHWSDAGTASWYDFAIAIQELGLEKGLLADAIPVRAIATEEYPLPAPRPAYSVLDKRSTLQAFNIENIHWRKQLNAMMDGLNEQETS
jgi:dTDP-4-dehydrorhamnose reductase